MQGLFYAAVVILSIPLAVLLRWSITSLVSAAYAEFFTPLGLLPEAPTPFFIRWTVGSMLSNYSATCRNSSAGARDILDLTKKIGRTFKARMFFGTPYILTTDPLLVKRMILQRPSNYVKSDSVRKLLGPVLGERGVFIAGGVEHYRMRRAIVPSFHADSLLKLSEWFLLGARNVTKKWIERTRWNEHPTLVDVFGDVTRMSFDVIIWTVFGKGGLTEAESQRLYELYKKVTERQLVDNRGFVLMQMCPFVLSLITSVCGEMRSVRKMLRTLVLRARRTLENQKRMCSSTASAGEPLIGTLLGESFSPEESVDCVLTFLGAGQATSAVTTCWVLYAIANEPMYQKNILEELADVKFDSLSPSSLAGISKCRQLDNICKEILRLYPPISYAVRTVRNNDKVGDIEIPRGYNVRVAIRAMQRDPKFWGDDAKEFVPERWDRPSERLRERMSFLPFLYGNRSCIGNRFAMLEIKACVACILSQLELSVNKADPPARAATSMGTPCDMKIYARLRSAENLSQGAQW